MNDVTPPPAPAPAASALRRSLPHRFKAAGIHLGLSAVIFVVALYLILVRWYPGFHFGVDGGWQGVRIMAAVDLVLGPMLTLVIFNPFKARRLIVFDLSCIGIVQVAALAWGFYAIEGQRPVAIAFHEQLFYSVPARSLRASGDADRLAQLSDRSPALVFVAAPADAKERERARVLTAAGGLVHEAPYFFRAFAPHWDEMQAWAIDASQSTDAGVAAGLAGLLARHGGAAADYRFFRYQGGYGSCLIAFRAGGELVDAFGCEAQ